MRRKKYAPDEITIEARERGPRRDFVVLVGGRPRAYRQTQEEAIAVAQEVEKELHEHKKREHNRLSQRKNPEFSP